MAWRSTRSTPASAVGRRPPKGQSVVMPSLHRTFGFLVLGFTLFGAACMKNNPPPAADDEQVFLPSGRVYERTPQVIAGERHDPRFDLVAITHRNVAEAAQAYADFSEKEVRVPKSLLERPLRLQGGNAGATAIGYAIQYLDEVLDFDGVDVVKMSRNVAAFRSSRTETRTSLPRKATEAEIGRYATSFGEERFWEIMEDAGRSSQGRCQRMADALRQSLKRLTDDELLGFELRFQEKMNESYRWDLWAVAYIANGGASDDGFTYFRAWLIGQGRERFEAAIRQAPDALNGLSTSSRHGSSGEFGFECEALLYPAMEVYQARTGGLPPMGLTPHPSEPAGTPWKEEDLPKLYPDLHKRFR